MFRLPSAALLAAAAASLSGCIPQVEQPPEYASRPAPYPPPASQPPPPAPPPPQAYEPPAATVPPAQAEGDACGATQLSPYINLLPSQDVKDKVATIVGARSTRWIAYGAPVTMDYRAERLNAELGQDGRIKAFRCY